MNSDNFYTCCSVYSLTTMADGFLIPAFSRTDSNALFFQDLNYEGILQNFYQFDESSVFSTSFIVPPIPLKIGDFGLIAFVDDEGRLYLENAVQIQESVKAVRVADPFTNLELATFTKNRKLHEDSLIEASAKFSNRPGKRIWVKSEAGMFERHLAGGLRTSSEKVESNSDLISQIEMLETDLQNEGWGAIWMRLWGQSYERFKLVGLANLKFDINGFDHKDALSIFFLISKSDFSEHSHQRLVRSLAVADLGRIDWSQAYHYAFWRYHDLREELLQVGLGKLQEFKANDSSSGNWISIWSTVYGYSAKDEILLEMGVEYVFRRGYISYDMARTLILALCDRPTYFAQCANMVTDWLEYGMRSDNVWARIFLTSFHHNPSEKIVEIGIDWLDSLGGNLTAWGEVWRVLENKVDPTRHTKLALQWLARARRDLREWVDVYFLLFERGDKALYPALAKLGIEWHNGRHGNNANRKRVFQALRYIEAMEGK